jgi:hypothetical protein
MLIFTIRAMGFIGSVLDPELLQGTHTAGVQFTWTKNQLFGQLS